TPHGGLALMSSFLARIGWRKALASALPHRPTSPNAYRPEEIALGFMAGVLSGADKFSPSRAALRRSCLAGGAWDRGDRQSTNADALLCGIQPPGKHDWLG